MIHARYTTGAPVVSSGPSWVCYHIESRQTLALLARFKPRV